VLVGVAPTYLYAESKDNQDGIDRPSPVVHLYAGVTCRVSASFALSADESGWITSKVSGGGKAYISALWVDEDYRGRGIGAALVAAFFKSLDRANVDGVLLHYFQMNPLSAPFWNRMGSRPLYTTWRVQPVRGFK
jgi:ribosomal protein S18 acetylase RimI-like enzyme